MIRLLLVQTVLIGIVAASASAQRPQEPATVVPESIDIDVGEMKPFEELIEGDIEKGRAVGGAVLLARGDKIRYLKHWGRRDRENDIALTADTIYRIYSMTKPITSVAAMQLVEQGKVELDEPAETYLPALAGMKVAKQEGDQVVYYAPPRAMTVRDLFRHTSGLSYGVWPIEEVHLAYYTPDPRPHIKSAADLVARLGNHSLVYEPGAKWMYSYASDVLAELVASVSGQRFDHYLRQHILDPLAMNDTFFLIPEEKRNRFAALYTPDGPESLKLVPAKSTDSYLDPTHRMYSGGGGLASTLPDYFRFCLAMVQGGELDGKRILQTKTVDEMLRGQLPNDVQIDDRRLMKEGYDFGLGFAVTPHGAGWGGAAGTRFSINRKTGFISIFMTQIRNYSDRNYGEMLQPFALAASRPSD